MMALPTKLLLITFTALLACGAGLYLQIQRNGELQAATDRLAVIVADQAREAQRQGEVLASHQSERTRLQGEYETTRARLRDSLRGQPVADCVVPVDVRVRLNAGADQAGATTRDADGTNRYPAI